MALKRISKNKKPAGSKISLAKLSNKKLNKLAKQGKLKKSKFGKKKLLTLIKERTGKLPKPEADGSHIVKVRDDPDEIPVEEADYEYFSKSGRDFSFLHHVGKGRKIKRKGLGDEGFSAMEGKHEAKRGKLPQSSNMEVKHLLPIKSKDGGIVAREEMKETCEDVVIEDSKTGSSHLTQDKEEEAAQPDSTVHTFAERNLSVEQSKQIIALLCTSIVEAPEDNVGKLKELRQLLGDVDGTVPVSVRKMSMLSLMEVFKDIIPGYRIRVLTEKEKKQSMKKDTKKLNQYEEALLNNYRHYLESVESILTGKPVARKEKKSRKVACVAGIQLSAEEITSLSEIALRCLCGLLTTHPHFNFRTNIISLIVRYVNHKDPKFSDVVCDTVKKLFSTDKSGEPSLEVVRLIGRIVKVRNFQVQPKVLKTFLSLKIKEVETGESESGQNKNKRTREQRLKETSRKDRKREKRFAYLEKELIENAVLDDKKRRLRVHTEIINVVFLTYFRILKHARLSVLLSTVLEGLAKFAHLINVTFFDDLFSVITELVDSGDLGYRESLHCIQTALTLLMGHGSAFNIDPQRFYTHLYSTLFHLHAGSAGDDVSVALHCLDIVLNKRRRQVTHQRVLAFIKRLTTLALQMDSGGALALLASVKTILKDHPKADAMLETETHGSGVFQPDLDEPELCNAHNTALYELHLLMRSYNSDVRQYARHVLETGLEKSSIHLPGYLARKTPVEIFAGFDSTRISLVEKNTPKKKRRVQAWSGFTDETLKKATESYLSWVDSIDLTSFNFS